MPRTTVMVHLATGGDYAPSLHSDSGGHYVWIDLNAETRVCVRSLAEADALIKAGTVAKDLLASAGQAAAKSAPASPHTCSGCCGAEYATGRSASGVFRCTLAVNHDGDHEAEGATEYGEPPLTWPAGECLAQNGGYACTRPAGHPGQHEGHGAIPLPVWDDGDTTFRDGECQCQPAPVEVTP